MSGGASCPASCHGRERENVRVLHLRHNHSAFNGYHYTPSDYSSVMCIACGINWRTKADWIFKIPLLKKGEHPHQPEREGCK